MQMRTILPVATRSRSIAADPQAVLDLIADPTNLPRWAPGFATSVREGPEATWTVTTGERSATVRVAVSRASGTVDLLPVGGRPGGAYLRVLANGGGSELVFTLVFPATVATPAVDAQMAIVAAELDTVRRLCEAPGDRPS